MQINVEKYLSQGDLVIFNANINIKSYNFPNIVVEAGIF